jgi:hypothetical protein
MLSFGEALDKLKDGYSVLRFASPIEFKEIILVNSERRGGLFTINFEDYESPFYPDFDDMMSEDWYVVCKTFEGT